MNRLLIHDQKIFEGSYRGAKIFLTEAHLRYELITLAMRTNHTSWEKERMKELVWAPAISQEGFKSRLLGVITPAAREVIDKTGYLD